MPRPLAELAGPIRALFSDLDGTMTSNGRVEAETYSALERLGSVQIPIFIVTGRPAGWGQAIASICPVAAVVAENGGVTFVREGHTLRKFYGVPPSTLPEWRRRMRAAAGDVMTEVPGARMSADSKYREVDLAIDWNEEVHLSVDEADHAVAILRDKGFAATRSSVHVNYGPPEFDKLSAVRHLIDNVLGQDPNDLSGFVYVGDSLNDATMFSGFSQSVGVANVRRWAEQLETMPAFITPSEEGAGLREVVEHILNLPSLNNSD